MIKTYPSHICQQFKVWEPAKSHIEYLATCLINPHSYIKKIKNIIKIH